MKPANFAPAYMCLYPQLAEIARSHGYAMAAHGTCARDFDVVCIPWVAEPSPPQAVVNDMVARFTMREVGTPEVKHHGRLVYTLVIMFGECFVDLSFMPCLTEAPKEAPMFEVGDVVNYRPGSGRILHCGSGTYPMAIVVKVSPLVLVSPSGDMRWESTVAADKLEKIGHVDGADLEVCMRRLES